MGEIINKQDIRHYIFYILFGIISTSLIIYYFSDTILHFTTPQQFPINSFERFPLSYLIFPAEVFSALFAIYFIYCLIIDRYKTPKPLPLPKERMGKVAILLPVYNEPTDIVERTIKACTKIRWSAGTKIYVLDDSTKDEHITAMKELAKKYGCQLVRRDDRIGYKAGNVNNALKIIEEPYFTILDADQAPFPEYLEQTMDHFSDPAVGFIQTPQYFINENTYLERATKLGANIFFHAQCAAKARDGALPFCGTNAIIRADVFRKVGGLAYYTSTEDIDIGLRMNEAGFHGVYVPEILVHGYAPQDFLAYATQQYRWANGNLAILRQNWFRILGSNTSLRHQIHTFFTLSWWLIGIVTLIYILVPLLSLITGQGTHHTWLPTAMFFVIYFNVIMGIGMIYMALHKRTSEKVRLGDALLQYSLITNSLFLYAKAAIAALFKRYTGFMRTSKEVSATSWKLVKWNLLLGAVCFVASIYSLAFAIAATSMEQLRTNLPISIWLLFYAVVLFSSLLFVGGTKVDTVEDAK